MGRVPSSGQLQHVASLGGFNSAPTDANTFGFQALFGEIRSVVSPNNDWRTDYAQLRRDAPVYFVSAGAEV